MSQNIQNIKNKIFSLDLSELKKFEKFLIDLNPIKNNNEQEIKNRIITTIDNLNSNKLKIVFRYFDKSTVYNKIKNGRVENLSYQNIMNLGEDKDKYLNSLEKNNIQKLDPNIFILTQNFLIKLDKEKFLSIPFKTLNNILNYITLKEYIMSSEQTYNIITEDYGSRLISFIDDNSIQTNKKYIIQKIIEKSLKYPNFNSSEINSDIFKIIINLGLLEKYTDKQIKTISEEQINIIENSTKKNFLEKVYEIKFA